MVTKNIPLDDLSRLSRLVRVLNCLCPDGEFYYYALDADHYYLYSSGRRLVCMSVEIDEFNSCIFGLILKLLIEL